LERPSWSNSLFVILFLSGFYLFELNTNCNLIQNSFKSFQKNLHKNISAKLNTMIALALF
jgi:hypothetical protein